MTLAMAATLVLIAIVAAISPVLAECARSWPSAPAGGHGMDDLAGLGMLGFHPVSG
jgi:hypothetical protein